MENINDIIANNLKRIREKQGISLEKTAELTGVSKTMLCQIEKGASSPSMSTLYKISNALKISLSSLISSPQLDAVVVDKTEIMPIQDEGKNMRIYTMFPFGNGRNFEIFYGEVEPGGNTISEAHQSGTEEYLTVFSGNLIVQVEEKEYFLPSQHAIGFRADVPHSYKNQGDTTVLFCNTIYYAEK